MKFSKFDANIVFELGRWNHNASMRTLMHKKGHLHSGLGISLVHHQHQVYKKMGLFFFSLKCMVQEEFS